GGARRLVSALAPVGGGHRPGPVGGAGGEVPGDGVLVPVVGPGRLVEEGGQLGPQAAGGGVVEPGQPDVLAVGLGHADLADGGDEPVGGHRHLHRLVGAAPLGVDGEGGAGAGHAAEQLLEPGRGGVEVRVDDGDVVVGPGAGQPLVEAEEQRVPVVAVG